MVHRTKTVDMSPDAIDRRLRDLSQLYELGMALRDAKRIGPIESKKNKNSPQIK